MEELRAHVRKYGPVMQRYYVQYLSGFDAVVLNELVQVRRDGWDWVLKCILKIERIFVQNDFMKRFLVSGFLLNINGIRQMNLGFNSGI